MTTKTYPLKIEVWGEDGEELLSRGHHDPITFLAAVVRHLRETDATSCLHDGQTSIGRRELLSCGALYGCGHRPGRQQQPCPALRPIEHQWRRWLPPHKPCGCEWDDLRYTRIVDGPGRGVFPVTVVNCG